MTVRRTSIENHLINEIIGMNGCIKEQIRILVTDHGPLTRREISGYLGLDTATTSGLVRPLIKERILMDGRKIRCPETGRPAFEVMVRPVVDPSQRRLFDDL
jgi:hypothetical protein